jgi:hypothetical protein
MPQQVIKFLENPIWNAGKIETINYLLMMDYKYARNM